MILSHKNLIKISFNRNCVTNELKLDVSQCMELFEEESKKPREERKEVTNLSIYEVPETNHESLQGTTSHSNPRHRRISQIQIFRRNLPKPRKLKPALT